jgi:hypothetical protein
LETKQKNGDEAGKNNKGKYGNETVKELLTTLKSREKEKNVDKVQSPNQRPKSV